jgi:RNA-binding protein YhbY
MAICRECTMVDHIGHNFILHKRRKTLL